jgi:hypothetical protein
VSYEDGTRNNVNTVDECLATDYLDHGAVRLLQWEHPRRRRRRRRRREQSGSSGSECDQPRGGVETAEKLQKKTSFTSDVSFLATSADGLLLLCGSEDG